MAEKTAYGMKRSKNQIALAFNWKIDAMLMEEMSMILAEQYCAIDLKYQLVRRKGSPWGGFLLIGTGDSRQIRLLSGTLLWMSPLMTT